MKPIIKGEAIVPDHEFKTIYEYTPDDISNFGVTLEIGIGVQGEDGVDNYKFVVCTPSFLEKEVAQNVKGIFCRGYLVVKEYNAKSISDRLEDIVRSIEGSTWSEVDNKLRAWFFSEFE